MKNKIVVRAGAALVLLYVGVASADTVPVNPGTTVPPSVRDALGNLGGSGPDRGSRGPYSGDGDPTGSSGAQAQSPGGVGGVSSNQTEGPSVVPLPPAVLSGLVGLAAVGIIGRLRRRSLSR